MIRVFLMLSCEDDLCHRQADAWLHGEGKANRILTVAWRSSLPCPRYVLLSWSQKTKRRQILFEAQIHMLQMLFFFPLCCRNQTLTHLLPASPSCVFHVSLKYLTAVYRYLQTFLRYSNLTSSARYAEVLRAFTMLEKSEKKQKKRPLTLSLRSI